MKAMENSILQTQASITSTDETVLCLQNISSSVSKASVNSQHIATSVEQQNVATKDVSKNVTDIAILTDSTAAKSVESLDNVRQLSMLASQLAESISHFKLPKSDTDINFESQNSEDVFWGD